MLARPQLGPHASPAKVVAICCKIPRRHTQRQRLVNCENRMQPARDASAAYSRIAVLSAHLTVPVAHEISTISSPGCSAPTYARAATDHTSFARPARHESSSHNDQQNFIYVKPRLVGPKYQPTKPGTYHSYAKRASAEPRFARPIKRTDDGPPAVDQSPRAGNIQQVNIVNHSQRYQMEVALPGVSAGDIRLDLRGTNLLITGKQGMTGIKMESVRPSPGGTFRAQCKLPKEVDTSSLRAEFLNGLLCIKARKLVRG